jgi:hypothetical protein
MKKHIITLALFLLAGVYCIDAQKSATINFEKTIHDFGRIKEDGGKVSYKFKFTNSGKQPIIIKNVESSCGCTTPEWSKTPILPGKEGFVGAEYDPIDRPGLFSKEIKIFNNITSEPIKLEIKGDVIPKIKEVADLYRYNIDNLRLVSNHVAFARITNTEKKTQSVDVINDSNKPIKIGIVSIPTHLSITASPDVLKPKQTGKIVIEYDGSKKEEWGYTTDRIVLKIDDKAITGSPLNISATIMEDFSKLTPEELTNAPTMDIDEKEFNFGTIKQGEKVTHEFKFTNNGKRDLIIRDIQSSCGCTAVDSKKVIGPGESSTIKATFNSDGKSGKQNKTITLVTNIPGKNSDGSEKHRIVFRIKGEVK